LNRRRGAMFDFLRRNSALPHIAQFRTHGAFLNWLGTIRSPVGGESNALINYDCVNHQQRFRRPRTNRTSIALKELSSLESIRDSTHPWSFISPKIVFPPPGNY
jgi:hypothetical protein